MGKLGEIALSWVLSPMLGGLVSYLVFSRIKKKCIRLQRLGGRNLKTIKQEKKAYKEQHRLFFEALNEAEKVEYATKVAHDAQLYDEPDFEPSELQSDYYRGLYELDNRKNNVDSYKSPSFLGSLYRLYRRYDDCSDADFQRIEQSAFGHE